MHEPSDPGTRFPELSVIVIIASDTTELKSTTTLLASCLEALDHQANSPSLEVIVPYLPPLEGIKELTRRYPRITFFPVVTLKGFVRRGASREHHDRLRVYGLELARGEIVGLLEDNERPDQDWCARIVEAHQQKYPLYAGVGGAVENSIDRPLNWAVYFCDFGKYQNPVPQGNSKFMSDVNASYKRTALESIRPVWVESFHETSVNQALTARGEKLVLLPDVIVYQARSNLRLRNALRERFIWGRSFAATRCRAITRAKRMLLAALSPLLPAVLFWRMSMNVLRTRRNIVRFAGALPIIVLLTTSWAWGEFVGYTTAAAEDRTGFEPGKASISSAI